jgi:hypothetical protein
LNADYPLASIPFVDAQQRATRRTTVVKDMTDEQLANALRDEAAHVRCPEVNPATGLDLVTLMREAANRLVLLAALRGGR